MDIMTKAKNLISTLTFDECIKLHDALSAGHPMMDLLADRMEELDPVRFEKWLDYEE